MAEAQNDPLLPGYSFNAHLVAGLTPIEANGYLDFFIDRPLGMITGEHPVLLLDDVLSELDEGRKQYLLTRMKEKQTFVTSCDDTAFLKTDGEVYRMNGGVLSRA